MRKIVQIAARAEGETTSEMMVALCDDGTLWGMWPDSKGWKKLLAIPQDEPAQNGGGVMGWKDVAQAAAENAMFATDEGGHAINKHSLAAALLAMPAPDRIALAHELLAGTGKCVANVAGGYLRLPTEQCTTEFADGHEEGWDDCLAAMLGDEG